MKLISLLIGLGLVIAMASSIPQADPINYATLKQGFKNPPTHARPKVYWWWLNGYVDTLRMKEELQAIKNAGLAGVDIFEIGLPEVQNPNQMIPSGPAFMSDAFLKGLRVALTEARRLELEVGINLASSWNAGGSWTAPQHAAKTLYVSTTTVSGGTEVSITIPFPTIPEKDPRGRTRVIAYGADRKPVYREEVAVLAFPAQKNGIDTAQVINVSRYFNPASDRLTWTAPAGDWVIQRYVSANSGEQLFMPSVNSVGPIIDHFDSSATRAHLNYFIQKLKPLVGDFATSPIKYLYLASYEAKEFAWTASLPAMFLKTNGYSIYKYLPLLINPKLDDPTITNRFQHDFQKTVSELMIQNHYRKAREICHEHGLKIASESGGPGVYPIPVETLKALGALDIPRGEFWHKTTRFDKDSVDIIWLVKEIAAASHIYKRGAVEEEAFTSFNNDWQEGPSDLKPLADRAFCEGMNRLVIHGFTHNPSGMGHPGIAYFAGTHYNDRNGWWTKSKPFNDYLGRISLVLQKTHFVADVLHYYGDNVPNLVPPKNTRFAVGPGYDYEIVDTEVLLRNLTVENGKWVLPGVGTYSVLNIGTEGRIPAEVRSKLDQLAKKGARLVESSAKPIDALKAMNVAPDFSYADQKADQRHTPIDYIHYQQNGLDFYLVRNTTNQWITKTCTFRQSGKKPEIWNPVTGNVVPIATSSSANGRTSLLVTLPPNGAYFVVFGKETGAASGNIGSDGLASAEQSKTIQTLDGSWQLRFPKGWGAPESATFPKLMSWTESEQAGIKYFSGIATYQKSFDYKPAVAKNGRLYLDLGWVSKVGEVWLNGKPLGIVWTPPYRVDITDVVKPGANVLNVEVANTWSNRLTGDAITGEKFTKTNITKAYNNRRPWGELPLIESGLLGPVTLVTIN